ncbi:MAG: DoxX family protein [Cellvibrionaceae bacterium]
MKKGIIIALSIFICFVFLQSLPFKFSNSLETQHIFGTLAEWSGFSWFGVYGGYMIGAFELIGSLMLLIPILGSFAAKKPVLPLLHSLGAVLALGIMTGAIYFHLFTPLGIVQPHFNPETGVQIGDDSPGILFIMACFTWLSALILIILDWQDSNSQLKQFLGKS